MKENKIVWDHSFWRGVPEGCMVCEEESKNHVKQLHGPAILNHSRYCQQMLPKREVKNDKVTASTHSWLKF